MYILFDIGGTNTRIAYSSDGQSFEEPIIVETPRDFRDGMKLIGDTASKAAAGRPLIAAGGGIAGLLNRDRSIFLRGPHLSGWNGHHIREELSTAIGVPTYVENDTAIVGLGEAIDGAGKDGEIVAYITVSTGVGGVRIVRKQIDVARYGFEPGHQIIDAGGGLKKEDEPPFPGIDLEAYISGSSVTTRYGKKLYEITDDAFWDRFAQLLAYGLNNTIVHWSPDTIVIGGSMMKKIGIPVPLVERYLRGIMHIYPDLPRIVHSSLGDIGGIHGALAYTAQTHKIG